jgi:CDP-diacylglycerol--glycerol-3-phosphate 3-phosphatidyltransferase
MAAAGWISARGWRAAPNIVTLARLALVVPSLALAAAGLRFWAASLVGLMFATDGLDGYLARRLGRVTELGKILDPAVDKLAVGALLLFLVVSGEFPVWAFLLVIARDVSIAAAGAAIARRTGSVPSALPAGKVALCVLAAVVIIFVADLERLEPAALIVLALAVVASGAAYAVAAARFFRADAAS